MSSVEIVDPDGYMAHSGQFNLDFIRALTLLAQATAPAPDSRYQTNSIWSVAKYSQVDDPRLITGRFTVNAGIEDLDPHQKSVLSDDMGVAMSLGLLDQQFGIVGLADVYQLVSQGVVSLVGGGRHRSMPDFLLLLAIPFNGSRLIFLECKGSQQPYGYRGQLVAACERQLANVAIPGLPALAVPRVAMAARIVLGTQPIVHVADPPIVINTDADIHSLLKRNWLALEYSLFRDFEAAERVFVVSGLKGWGFVPEQVRRMPIGVWHETVPIHIPKSKIDQTSIRGEADHMAGKAVRGTVSVMLEPTETAKEIRRTENWERVPEPEGTISSDVDSKDHLLGESRKRRSGKSQTYTGTRAEIDLEISSDV